MGKVMEIIPNMLRKSYGINPDIELVWIVKDEDPKMPSYIKQVKLFSISGMKECASAKVWVSNARLHLFLYKKKQKYFQLWHGGCGPKRWKVQRKIK